MKPLDSISQGQILWVSMLVCWMAAIMPADAQEGYTWERWQQMTGVPKPSFLVTPPQQGQADLMPILAGDDPSLPRIETIAQWEAKRDRILSQLKDILGTPNEKLQTPPPYVEVLGDQNMGRYLRRKLRVNSEPNDWIPAYLLLPKPLPTRPMPVMIVLHQTVAQGKDEPVGINAAKGMDLAVQLVRRGFICMAYDQMGFGERIPTGAPPYTGALQFYTEHPQWSYFGKMVWDFQRVVDYLVTLPEVDAYRIGAIGHSHGAYSAIICSAFEPRISAVVASCGYTTLRGDPAPDRWSRQTPLLPQLGHFLGNIDETPFDWQDVVACLAPRPYFQFTCLDDKIFPHTENQPRLMEDLRAVYGLYGAADNLCAHFMPGDHEFCEPVRGKAMDWLSQKLPPRPDPKVMTLNAPITLKQWRQEREALRATLLHDLGAVDQPPLAPTFEELERQSKDGLTLRKIRYLAAPGESVTAYLVMPPDDMPKGKKPAMIVFNETTKVGKREAAGLDGDRNFQFGPELARRGYVVLCTESIASGERIGRGGPFDTRDHYKRWPAYSAMGKMIQDGRRAIDLLQAMPAVDAGRMGAMGISLGGEQTLFVTAFDERIKAAVGICGYAPFRVEKNMSRWSRDHFFSYMPLLRVDLNAKRLPAWDFDAPLKLIAPRPYVNYQTLDDQVFPEADASTPMAETARPIWRLYGQEQNLVTMSASGLHQIVAPEREKVYQWLDRQLSARK